MPDRRPPAPSLLPILSVHFIGTLGFSIVLPFLVYLVTRWGGNAVLYGLVGATYSLFQLIGAPVLGRWSDRYGRRRILLLSQIGTLVSWGLFVLAFALPVTPMMRVSTETLGTFTLTLPLLLVVLARALDGLTGGNVSVASAYLADVTPEERRSENFGKLSVSANLGFVLGPAIAGLLGATRWGELLPVLAAMSISALATMIIAFRLPESNPCVLSGRPRPGLHRTFGQEAKDCFELEDRRKAAGSLLRLPFVAVVLSIYFLVMLAFSFFYVAFPVHAATGLDWSVTRTGVFFSVLSLAMSLVQGPGLRWAARRSGDRARVFAGGVVLAASFAMFAVPAEPLLWGGALLLAVGNGLMWPSVLAILSRVGEEHQGAVQGLAGSAGAVASIVGLLLGGLLFHRVGATLFLAPAVVVGVTLLLAARLPDAGSASPPSAAGR